MVRSFDNMINGEWCHELPNSMRITEITKRPKSPQIVPKSPTHLKDIYLLVSKI